MVNAQTRALEAEQAVIGAMLQSATATTEARELLSVADFWQPRHAVIFNAICDLADAKQRADAVAVLPILTERGELAKVGGTPYLHTLIASCPLVTNIGHYARQVRSAARRRSLGQLGERLTQIAEDVTDDDDMYTAAAEQSIHLQLLVDEPDPNAPVESLSTWSEFIAAERDRPHHFVVPRLIERQDVFLLLAPPGAGKSWLSRQMCWSVAAGVHPFHEDVKIRPARTLLVDLENPPSMVARQSVEPLQRVESLGEELGDRGHVWRVPQGMNLRERADAQLLERVIAETQPELVAFGSLYKSFRRGNDHWDVAADEVRAVLDKMRARYRVAFWLEHHMPKAKEGSSGGNPYGSSIWEWWPGYGRVLERITGSGAYGTFALRPTFRGDRDVREIPPGLQRSSKGLPWQPVWDQNEIDRLDAEEKLLRSAKGL
jgi:hypothetical protein